MFVHVHVFVLVLVHGSFSSFPAARLAAPRGATPSSAAMRSARSALLVLLLAACETSSVVREDASTGIDSGTAPALDAGAPDAPPPMRRDAMVEGEDFEAEAEDFGCILEWPMVRRFRITNTLGHLDDALAVANSETGGTYPVGTIIQLVPGEAMVKRGRGWSPETNDWEFFALDVSAESTTIRSRGAAETVNQFGGNCFDCHRLAEPQWDFVCEDDHGCDPLPLSPELLLNIQNGDPRCP